MPSKALAWLAAAPACTIQSQKRWGVSNPAAAKQVVTFQCHPSVFKVLPTAAHVAADG